MARKRTQPLVRDVSGERVVVVEKLIGDINTNLPTINDSPGTAQSSTTIWPQLFLKKLVGREDDLAWGRSVLMDEQSPRLALRGLPGVGKTTLAFALAKDKQVAKRFSNGLLWGGLVRKETRPGSGKFTNNIDSVLQDWAAALGIREQFLRKFPNPADKARQMHIAMGGTKLSSCDRRCLGLSNCKHSDLGCRAQLRFHCDHAPGRNCLRRTGRGKQGSAMSESADKPGFATERN